MKITKKGFSGRVVVHKGELRLSPTAESLHMLQHATFKEGSDLFVATLHGLKEGGYSPLRDAAAEFAPNPLAFLSGHAGIPWELTVPQAAPRGCYICDCGPNGCACRCDFCP